MIARKLTIGLLAVILCCGCGNDAPAPEKRPSGKTEPEETGGSEMVDKESYNIYLGNTHAHTLYSGDATQTDDNSAANHYKLARENGYDFYCVTDHSQYESYTPEAWADIASAADAATVNGKFVAIRGYEHSENNGPGAKGHQNVFNSQTYLNALADGIDMQYFHNWLAETTNKDVIVSMNHPKTDQYSTFACYNEAARSHVSLIELINGPKAADDYHDSFLVALSKGWKVSPVAGCDNHAVKPISTWPARTGVAAKELTRASLFEAMAAGRTYATYDINLKVLYYVDNRPMGSRFKSSADTLKFDIEVEDPDTSDDSNRIVRIEIVRANGTVAASETFSEHHVSWKPEVKRDASCYSVKIYNAAITGKPVAYAAPVWLQ